MTEAENIIRAVQELKHPLPAKTPILVADKNTAMELLKYFHGVGYTAYCIKNGKEGYKVLLDDYLPPVKKDGCGFFVENDALTERIRRELSNGPYFRERTINPAEEPFLLTEEQRCGSEDVMVITPGRKGNRGYYHQDYRYITSRVFCYSNLERCVRAVIADFDIYGFDYEITREQWGLIKETAFGHSQYAANVVEEIQEWLDSSEVDMASDDVYMMLLCI